MLKKDGVDLPISPIEVNDTSRVISLEKQATPEDSSTYLCVGTLRRGGQNTRDLTLTVKGKTRKCSRTLILLPPSTLDNEYLIRFNVILYEC